MIPDGALLFRGGLLWSPADQVAPVPGELLVVDGRIAAVGTELSVPEDTEVIELAGGTLLPAFGDGHAHPLQAGVEECFAPVRGDSLTAIYAGVGEWARAHPDAEWIYGGGFDLALTPDGVFDAQWLDAVVADRPVVLRGVDYHTMWCNTEALIRSGLTADTPEPADGTIVRRADGSPIGTLREWGATDPVFAAMPAPGAELQVEALRTATASAAAVGLTWMQDAWVEPHEVPIYLAALRAGALRVEVNLAFRADPAHWQSQVQSFTGLRAEVDAAAAEWAGGGSTGAGRPAAVTARTVKFFVDGVIESGTASMLAPYLDCPHSCGMPLWSRPELAAAVAAFSTAGFQVHLHAIGDAAVRDALDAIEQSAAVIGELDLRPVIAHLQVLDPADVGRLASLGVIACFQPLWAQPDPLQEVLTIPRIGPERAALQYPIASALAAGAPVSFGSDWPVTDLAPVEGIATAVTRQTPEGQPDGGWYPAERIDLRSALTAYTAGVAHQAFRNAGRLTVGALADLVWFGADLSTADPAVLRSAPVVGTWSAGVRTH